MKQKLVVNLKAQQFNNNLSKFSLIKYMHFGINFFLSKNVGLDIQSGYLEIFYAFTSPLTVNEMFLFYHVNLNYFIIINCYSS
jgi:hypothetical protein